MTSDPVPRSIPGGLRHDLALLAAAASWGVNIPFMKLALREVDPLVFNALRFPLSVALVGFFALRERTELPRPGRSLLLRTLGLGLLGHFAYQVSFLSGVARTSAGSTALLIATSPLWVALLANRLGLDRLTRTAWSGLGAAFVGAALIAAARPGAGAAGAPTLGGNALVLAAALCWALYTVGSKPLLAHYAPMGLAFRTMAAAVVPLVLVALPAMVTTEWGELSWRVWLAVLFSGLFSSGFAFLLWNQGIRHVGPSHTAVYTNLVPVLTLVLGYFWLGEVPLPLQLTGGVLVLAGLVGMRTGRGQRENAKPAAESVGD